jgi:hypothetical protein
VWASTKGEKVKVIPVDASRLQLVVVGEPTAQYKDGQAVLDRDTGRPRWNIDVTVIGESRAETIQLAVPEGGFPKELGVGAFVTPEAMVAIHWERNGRWGVMLSAKSVKAAGGSAAVKGVAA